MARVSLKVQAAKAALHNLEYLGTLLGDAGAMRYHADSGSRYLEAIEAGGLTIPVWVGRNAAYLMAQGWRLPWSITRKK